MRLRNGKGIESRELAEYLFGYSDFLTSEAYKAKAVYRTSQSADDEDRSNSLIRQAGEILDLANELYESKEVIGAPQTDS